MIKRKDPLVGGFLVGLYHAHSLKRRPEPAYHMMNGAQRTDKATEKPAQEKGCQEYSKAPQKPRYKVMCGKQGGEHDQGIQVKEKGYRVVDLDIRIRGKGSGIVQKDILGKAGLNKEKDKQGQEEALAHPPCPHQVFRPHRVTFL